VSFRASAARALAGLLLVGCAAFHDDFGRARGAYDDARFEDARTWLVDLEPRVAAEDTATRATFFYYRGMTEYRLGARSDALHYLALAREVAAADDADLAPERRRLLERTLEELTPSERTHRPPPPAQTDAATSGGDTSGGGHVRRGHGLHRGRRRRRPAAHTRGARPR
jgi:hypothetical protein